MTLTMLWAPTIILYPMAWATRLSSIRKLSLSLVRPSPSSIKGDALSPNDREAQTTQTLSQTIRPPGRFDRFEHPTNSSNKSTRSKLSTRRSSHLSRPFGPESDQNSYTPILLPLVCNPTTNFEHLGSGIKSSTNSN